MSNQYSGDLKAAILEAVKKPEGMQTSELKQWKVPQIGRMVQKLQYAGLIHRAPIGGKYGRYFDTLQRAEAYAAERDKLAPVVTVKASKRWADDAPVVIPEGLKVQKAPKCPDRWAPSKNDKSWKLFSSLGPGKYLEAA